jgi:hypothetical protein
MISITYMVMSMLKTGDECNDLVHTTEQISQV